MQWTNLVHINPSELQHVSTVVYLLLISVINGLCEYVHQSACFCKWLYKYNCNCVDFFMYRWLLWM